MNECETAIKAEREKEMAPLLPWCSAEPCISLPLEKVLIDKDRKLAFITMADLAAAFGQP